VYSLSTLFGEAPGALRSGVQWRHDDIPTVGLYRTQERARLSTMREDDVRQNSYSIWASQDVSLAAWLRVEAGLRLDAFRFEVDSNIAPNSGESSDHIASPKLAVVLGPWERTELFLNWGRGFHSNDARGTTISVDPTDGVTPVERVTPLVRATGREIGVRSAVAPGLQLAASLWELKVASELLFIGDGGITEASRASRRRGLELSAYYTPNQAFIIDADLAFTRPRFTDQDPVGNRIPNAVNRVASLGISYRGPGRWSSGARLRHFGPAPLLEDNSVRSSSTTLVNIEIGYSFTASLKGEVTLLNVFDQRANDITYFYESQLPGEAAPVQDIHFHPVEPRALRLQLAARF
jgi:outer membrane receptor for ferrienterochelin and colicin